MIVVDLLFSSRGPVLCNARAFRPHHKAETLPIRFLANSYLSVSSCQRRGVRYCEGGGFFLDAANSFSLYYTKLIACDKF